MTAFASNPHDSRRAAEERLSALRLKLRQVHAQRKVRLKEFVDACRADRLALREQVREMRKRALDHLREQVAAARGAAKLVRITRLSEVRQTFGADLRGAQAALAVERQHQTELHRIAREEQIRRSEIEHAHHAAVTAGDVRSALLGKLSPFLQKEAASIVHVPGQSRGEALLHHAEKHPHKAHAVVDPHGARNVEETERAVVEAERDVRRVGGNPFVPAARPPSAKASEHGAAKKSPRRKGTFSMGEGIALDDLLRERDEVAAERATRAASRASGKPTLVHLPFSSVANANALSETAPRTPVPAHGASGARRSESDVKAPELNDTADLAKRIRADIKEAVKSKQLPRATYAVRTSKYSMGSSIDVVASKLPFPVLNPDAFHLEPGSHDVSFNRDKFSSRYTSAADEVLAKLNAIVDAYHWDRSDSASDYYNERFARDVKLDPGGELSRINAQKSGREASPKRTPKPAKIPAVRSKTPSVKAKTTAVRPKRPAKPVAGKPAAVGVPAAKPPSLSSSPKKTGTRRGSAHRASKAQQSLDTDSPLFANAPRFAPPARSPNAFELKKAARVDRMRARAKNLKSAADAAFTRTRQVGSAIPVGQPILIGHHSEARHRRDIARMDTLMRNGVQLSEKAEGLERRAAFADRNTAISSDDPDAIPKLKEKLAALGDSRAKMRAANVAIRKGGDVTARLIALGFTETRARQILEKDSMGRVGFPAYALQNTSSEERRIRERIAQLEARAASPARPDETIGVAVISEADNRVRISFPSKPAEDVRRSLKSAGFRWSPTANAWQRFAGKGAWGDARRILTPCAPPASIAPPTPTPTA